jgi:N-acetylneuraminic acid mutarotase
MKPSRLQHVRLAALLLALALGFVQKSIAQVPALIHYQGRVLADGSVFDGAGQFKFALVNANASQTYWRNSPDANSDGEPDTAVSMAVTRGLYAVALGDTSLANMAALPSNLFTNAEVYLRVWFTDGPAAFERLSPDQRIVAVGYAMIAASVTDGSISLNKLSTLARSTIQSAVDNTATLAARADDLSAQLTALSNRISSLSLSNLTVPAGLTASSTDPEDASLISQGYLAFNTTTPTPWANGSTVNAPSPRYGHTAVWTGSAWIVWGGNLGGGVVSSSGAIYRPAIDTWTTLATFNNPSARNDHTAVWTGSEMIIWGGFGGGSYLGTGAKFNPATSQWTTNTLTGAPSARSGHVAVWTGTRMLIWGGRNSSGLLNDGALYDPVADSWTALTLPSPPAARQDAGFAWAGDRLIIWGGTGSGAVALRSGAQLLFASGAPSAWSAMTLSSAPSARAKHSMVWTGQRILIWGGKSASAFVGAGASYNPAADQWQTISSTQAPTARAEAGTIWTGSEMLVLGGESSLGAQATSYAYEPALNRWRELANAGNSQARFGATAGWTGTEALLFGGRLGAQPLAFLQRVNPTPAFTFYRKP